jgi:hypothetical protein
MPRTQRTVYVLNGVTATTTSAPIFVGQARRVGIQIRCANHTSGNGVFTFKGSLEDASLNAAGVTLTALNVLIDNVTNTNAQNPTRIASKTLSANGDAFLWLDPSLLVQWLQVICTVTTDGTYTAFIVVEDEF